MNFFYLSLLFTSTSGALFQHQLRGGANDAIPKNRKLSASAGDGPPPGSSGYCPVNAYTLTVPILDLTGGDRPIIDGMVDFYGDGIGDLDEGWSGQEYSKFVEIPMFNGGKSGRATNGDDPYSKIGRIATAYAAYDCTNEIVCIAAHLHASYLSDSEEVGKATSGETVDPSQLQVDIDPQVGRKLQDEVDEVMENSWIQFGSEKGGGLYKLFQSNAEEFQYLYAPGTKGTEFPFTIGYEGCWNVADNIKPRVHNHIEIHFNRGGGQTTSSGKEAADGEIICLEPSIEPCVAGSEDGGTTTQPPPSSATTTTTTRSTTVVTTPDTGGDGEVCFAEDLYFFDRDTLTYNKECGDSGKRAPFNSKPSTTSSTVTTSGHICRHEKTYFPHFLSLNFIQGLDNCNQETSQTVTDVYIYTDTTAPEVFVEGGNQVFQCGDVALSAIVFNEGKLAQNDQCSNSAKTTLTRSAPVKTGDSCEETHTTVWTAEDECGNSNEVEHKVTIKDTTPPVITAPEDRVYQCGIDEVQMPDATIGDKCHSGLDVMSTYGMTESGSAEFCGADGKVLTRVWDAFDICGNVADAATQVVKIVDKEPPVIDMASVPSDKTYNAYDIDLSGGLPLTAETGLNVAATDACDSERWTSVTVQHHDFVQDHQDSPGITITRTFYSDDICGSRSATQQQVIDVLDSCSVEVSAGFASSDFPTKVSVTNRASATGVHAIRVTAENADNNGLLGDMRGLFFNCGDGMTAAEMDAVQVEIVSMIGNDGKIIDPPASTNYKCDLAGITALAKDVIMKGGGKANQRLYTCAVEVGTQGKSKDDVKKVVFDVYHPSLDITTNNCANGSDIGFRHTSVGSVGSSRNESTKTNGSMACVRNTAEGFVEVTGIGGTIFG